jgi:hypothetical protein
MNIREPGDNKGVILKGFEQFFKAIDDIFAAGVAV